MRAEGDIGTKSHFGDAPPPVGQYRDAFLYSGIDVYSFRWRWRIAFPPGKYINAPLHHCITQRLALPAEYHPV
jgi:hypothetical protein